MENAKEKVENLCKELNTVDPISFLTNIMSGKDPRRVSLVYLKIKALEEEYGEEPPDEWDWLELIDLIKREYQFSIVDIGKSQDAAKQLLEYMHPKRKSVDVTDTTKEVMTSSLNPREIKLLRKEFDLEF